MKSTLCIALGVAAIVTISCGGVVDPSNNQTENFSGTIQPLAAGGTGFVFPFNVSKSGEYSITVTSLTPATPNNIIGVGFGQFISGQCSPFTLNQFAVVGRTGSAGAIQQGSWCAIVFDPGILTAPVTFQANVKHP
jgi:hypothetical protein